MKFIKRVGVGLKGFGGAIVSIPKDIRRYQSIRKM